MRDKPTAVDDGQVVEALAEGWAIEVIRAEYLPVGAGSYHWSVSDRNSTWFVKVDDLGVDEAVRDEVFSSLRRSFETALTLHRDTGLGFVVAPIPAVDGAVLRRLTRRYAVAVFPMVDGTAGLFGPHRRQDLAELAGLLAELHRTTPAVMDLAPQADLRLPGRRRLLQALRTVDRPWTGGPHAEPARDLLIRHGGQVRRWLADFDRLVEVVRGPATHWVVTHGEPHPGNVIRTPAGLRLIDWTTVQIAPPERDLWMLTTAFTDMIDAEPVSVDVEVLARYTEVAGRTVTPAAVAFYRRRWVLADVAAFIEDLRGPHSDGQDAAAALTYLTGYLETAADR
jgi:phosphotransferase family enzyme